MIFTPVEQLSMIEINGENEDIVTFDRLAKLLVEKPANMVYCVKAGELYGIISMGDVNRAKVYGRNSVDINTSFTFLHGYEYMRARKLFLENDKINALPIIDEEHHLIGDYSRWDDVFSDYFFDFLKGNRYADMVWKKYRNVAIVQPSYQIVSKMKIVEVWEKFFDSIGIETEIISKQDIVKSFNDKDMVFFPDGDEMRGLETLYRDILGNDPEWVKTKTKTLEAVEEAVREAAIRDLVDGGVYIITLQVKENGSSYWKKTNREIASRFNAM